MKAHKIKACQRSLPFPEQTKVWQQIPSDIREEVIQLLTHMIQDYHHRKEKNHAE